MRDWEDPNYEFEDVDLQTAFDYVEDVFNKLDGMREWADEEGFRAVHNKIQEALGPLYSTCNALKQYDSGALDRR